jgi:drug/metabolite transporter (DMT)-like permease
MAAGINAALWAAVISLGAGVAMLIVASLAERGRPAGANVLQFALLSGLISYVAPNFLTYSVIPKIGSGLAAIMYALSPVVTALLSFLLRVRPPSVFGVIGIVLGLAGGLIIIVSRNAKFSTDSLFWLMAALLIPVFLGIGNIYRTLAWPQGASPRRLAAMTNLAAVPPLALIALVQNGSLDLAPLAAVPGLVALQIAVSTVMFLMFFQLQQLGGPTYLSQIGYVAAAVGVVIGVAWLGESYPPSVWLGAGVVAAGIALSTFAQIRQSRV